MIGVFASGTGSNFEALADAFAVSYLVCDRSEAAVIGKARRRNIPVHVVEKLAGESRLDHEARIWQLIKEYPVRLICLAGWMRILSASFLERFPQGSVLNIHPSLLPVHPGTEGYQLSHQTQTGMGVTVHEVIPAVDAGRIVLQAPLAFHADFDEFKKQGLALEHQLYVRAVKDVLAREHVYRIEVLPRTRTLLAHPTTLPSRVSWLKTQGPLASLARAAQVLSDDVTESAFWKDDEAYRTHLQKLSFPLDGTSVGFHPGVTDNSGHVMAEVLSIAGLDSVRAVRSGQFWRGDLTPMSANPLLQWTKPSSHPFEALAWQEVRPSSQTVRTINLGGNDEHLLAMNNENWWALTLAELRLVRDHFLALGRMATDVEMEIIAQTWSEHCKHKIFRAEIDFTDEDSGATKKIKSLFKTYIKGVTDRVREERQLDWLISVFDDNAGIVRWDDTLDVAIKVETHNSPSALDPYGGALTGILGVNRDILGVGMGARPVANTNVFCLPQENLAEHLGAAWPAKVIRPRELRAGVHAGVKDGGNKSGVPTVNGAFHYDVNFAGKPLVYCGTLGVLPQTVAGRPSHEKPVKVGDRIVMLGGRIGKDGLHGATFSSLEWKEGTPASVVQIGDPLTQKRVADFLLEARDLGLFTGLTDNGAGGLSSSIGEMSLFTGGARLDLALAPVKYQGLAPWELMVSESQERMSLAVDPTKLVAFMEMAKAWGVEASDLGEFTNSGQLEVFYHQEQVANLSLNFLHEGLPAMRLTARWSKDHQWKDWCESPYLRRELSDKPTRESLLIALKALLSHPNIRSHESWVRQYDHEVQAASCLKPFAPSGAPSDAGVIALAPHGGEEKNGVVVSSGLAPQLSRIDPYLMGLWAVDEAIRNALCTGADLSSMALVDNFCWPDPVQSEKNDEGSFKLGMLVRTCEGMADMALALGLPLVSGKDSMKNDAFVESKGQRVKISALPTLLMTCIARHKDVSRVLPSAPQDVNLSVVLLSARVPRMLLTAADLFKLPQSPIAYPELSSLRDFYQRFSKAAALGHFESAHDVSEGGVLVALSEIALGPIGLSTALAGDWTELLGEAPAQILVSVQRQKITEVRDHFSGFEVWELGSTTSNSGLRLEAFDCSLSAAEIVTHFRGGER